MKTLILFLGLLGGASPALAQATTSAAPAPGPGQLTGTVVDAAGQPVPFATVALLDAAGRVVNGVSSDATGQFQLTQLAAGTYTLRVSFVGYQTLERTGLAVGAEGLALGRLTLGAAPAQLGEVVVQGQRALVEQKPDRTVYHANQDPTTAGGDATDVLRRVPLLSVDLDGNVSLRGATNLRILLNGQPSTLLSGDLAQALKTIPADQIQTVEVITAPSAKYDAEGAGGVINIITKQNRLAGKTLDVRTTAGLRRAGLNLSGALQTRQGMTFTLTGGQQAEYNTPGTVQNTQLTTDPATGQPTRTEQSSATNHQQLTGRYNLGWDYSPTKRDRLAASAQLNLFTFNWQETGLLTQRFAPNDSLLGRDRRDVTRLTQANTLDGSLTYTHQFARPRHELSVLGLLSHTGGTNNFTNRLLDPDAGLLTGRLRNDNGNVNQELTAQADYQRPLGGSPADSTRGPLLEVGAKHIARRVQSDYLTQQAAGASAAYVPMAGLTNNFTYRQSVTAGYASVSAELPQQVSLRAGVRYEYTTLGADFATGPALSLPSYGVLTPSLNLARKLANGSLLRASFTRRLQRPSRQFLNPNLQAANPLDVTQGNPLLQPEFTNAYELGYNPTWRGLSFDLSAFVRTTRGSIEPLSTVRGDTVRTSFANLGRATTYGASLGLDLKPTAKLSLTGSVDLFYQVLRNPNPDPRLAAANQGWVFNGRFTASYRFNERWTVQAFGFRRGRELLAQGFQGGIGTYGLSTRRTFAGQKASLSLSVDNPFSPTFRIPNRLDSPGLTQAAFETRHMAAFRVSFGYRLGKLSGEPRPRKEITNDDLK